MFLEPVGDVVEVLVAAAGNAHEDILRRGAFLGLADGGGERVRAFEGGDDAFVRAQQLERGDGFAVGDAFVADAFQIMQQGVFGADAGIIEAGGNGPGLVDLAFVALEKVGQRAVSSPGEPPQREAAWRGVSRPSPAASAPIISQESSRKG